MPSPETSSPDDGIARRKDTVQSVERALRLLEVLTNATEPASALQLATQSGLNRTVVHRLVRTMTDFGLLEENRGTYQLGPRAVQLGYTYLDRSAVRRAALGYAVDLCFRFVKDRPWVVSLALPVGDEVILVDRIWGPNTPLDSLLDVGTRLRFEGSALGRSMLAYWERADVVELLGQERADGVMALLDKIKANNGVAITFNEVRPGLFAVACPILDPKGRPVASLCISGPVGSVEPLDEHGEIALHVRRATESIKQELTARRGA